VTTEGHDSILLVVLDLFVIHFPKLDGIVGGTRCKKVVSKGRKCQVSNNTFVTSDQRLTLIELFVIAIRVRSNSA